MLSRLKENINSIPLVSFSGYVSKVVGLTIESIGPACELGELCVIHTKNNKEIPCEVIGFENNSVLLAALSDMQGISVGDAVYSLRRSLTIKIGPEIIGRVLNGLGEPIDDKPLWNHCEEKDINGKKASILNRKRIDTQLQFGIKAIDAILPCAKGQRIGFHAGTGVGKSTLMGMIAKNTNADINIIALIGERTREVQEFIENELGADGLKRSVVVVATSDEPALIRIKAALLATTIAEYFREEGMDVMFMMDSVTRFAMAQREIGISVGEKVAQKGYTPSVFSMLAKLLERTGTSEKGTISAIYTVLVEGDDMNEPISDTTRGILDGHIVLSRKLANLGHYPAIDVLQSVSRLKSQIATQQHLDDINKFVSILAKYSEIEDLVAIGKIDRDKQPDMDYIITMNDICKDFLKQSVNESFTIEDSLTELSRIMNSE